jgi:hypothetical protein
MASPRWARRRARHSTLGPLAEDRPLAAARVEVDRHQVARHPDLVEADAADAGDLAVDAGVVVPEEAAFGRTPATSWSRPAASLTQPMPRRCRSKRTPAGASWTRRMSTAAALHSVSISSRV